MNADQVGNLATPVNPSRARAATGFALPQADDQLFTKLAHRQGVDGVVDRFATDVGVFKLRELHPFEFAGNLLRRKALSQQVDHKVEQFATWLKLACGPTAFAALAHLLMGLAGRIARCCHHCGEVRG